MDLQELQELVERYLSEPSSPQEIERLKQLLDDPRYALQLESIMDGQLENSTVPLAAYPGVIERLKTDLHKEISKQKQKARVIPLTIWSRWMTAAAILIVMVGVAFFWLRSRSNGTFESPNVASTLSKIAPGKDGAILTLADGRTIILDTAGNGTIATQNGSEILLKNGQLVYKAKASSGAVFNTITTPKGRQFSLVLPDGTKAWLNAASSLRYPTSFNGVERKVEITGEVYFEVAKNARMPFRVKVDRNTEVVVLGTHFNINSYTNEGSINTTLLEGSVQLINGTQKKVLKPGEQGRVNANKDISIVNDVDLKKIMAWKNGLFDFDDASLQEVMRQLERWYDIEVVYEKGVPDIQFVGTLSKDLELEDVLKGLKLSEVNFKMEGRKLVVIP